MRNEPSRSLIELFEFIIKEAQERGFGGYGICDLIDRLYKKDLIGIGESIKILSIIGVNRPKEIPHTQHYFWPNTPEYAAARIEFLQRILRAFKSGKALNVEALKQLVNTNN